MKIEKDNSGFLFPNHRKTTEKHPDLKGAELVDGVEYWASGWVNKDKNGQKYINLKLTLKGEGKSKVQKKLDDDIPF